MPKGADKSNLGLLGYQINRDSLENLIAQTEQSLFSERGQVVFACANPHSLAVANSDREFANALRDAEILVADGVGVALANRVFLGADVPRIPGASYFFALMHALNQRSLPRPAKVYFLGSTQVVLNEIGRRCSHDFPNVKIVGTLSPPFGEWSESTEESIRENINKSEADVLWVGMTAPKQEKWVFRNRRRIAPRAIGSIGAVFDFYAGTHKRAPEWMVRSGLEWLHRLFINPKRMWRRTFVSVPIFLRECVRFHLLKRN